MFFTKKVIRYACLHDRHIESLDFEQVAVRVFEKGVINGVFGIVSGRFQDFHAPRFQPFMPTIHIIRDQGGDYALWADRFEVGAKAQVAIRADYVDATDALVARQRQGQDALVEISGRCQVGGMQEGDKLLEGWIHRLSRDRNQRVRKKAAKIARKLRTTKNEMTPVNPELKIGDGGGCIT